jgi:hypothetical protein
MTEYPFLRGSPLIASKLIEKHMNIPSPKFRPSEPAMRTSHNFKQLSKFEQFE